MLPDLPYEIDALMPVISANQLSIHHDKHHKAYVDNANEILAKLKMAEEGVAMDFGALYKKLAFNVGGHILHSLFWENMRTPMENNLPEGELASAINRDFGSFENFWKEFFDVASTVEGSGWAVLVYDKLTDRLILAQVQNHQLNHYPTMPVLLVLDMWEHAYYLDYQNDKKAFATAFQKIVDWEKVGERLSKPVSW